MKQFRKMSAIGIGLVSVSALLATPVTSYAQQVAVDTVTPQSIVLEGATSVQMQVMQNGQSQNRNAGLLDNKGTPIGEQAYFRAGSVTKPFVATVIMQLVDEGKINLDVPIDTYIPGKVNGGDVITTRQLLSHRSGLQEYITSLPLYNIASYPTTQSKIEEMMHAAYNKDQLLSYINSRPLATTPGTAFSYANSNYVVAGEIIANVTHKPYEKNIQERILAPLGMTHTYFPGSDRNLPEPAAHGYQDMSDPRIGGSAAQDMATYNGSQVNAAGEIVSTTGDLNKFVKALATGSLVSANSYEQMITPISDMGGGAGYGLGVMIMPSACGTVIGHGGNIYGYATQAYSSPDGSRQVSISGTEGKMDYLSVTMATSKLAAQTMCQ